MRKKGKTKAATCFHSLISLLGFWPAGDLGRSSSTGTVVYFLVDNAVPSPTKKILKLDKWINESI